MTLRAPEPPGQQHGVELFDCGTQDAGRRVIHAADLIGIRGCLVHALDRSAKAFYHRIGFDESPLDSMTLMISLGDLRASLCPEF